MPELNLPTLTQAERDVLIALRGFSFSPSSSILAGAMHRTTRSVSACLGRLCTKGLVYSRRTEVHHHYPTPHDEVESHWRITEPTLEHWDTIIP
jgi:predicted transcriptional regulator